MSTFELHKSPKIRLIRIGSRFRALDITADDRQKQDQFFGDLVIPQINSTLFVLPFR